MRKWSLGFTITEVMIAIGILGMILVLPMVFWWGIGRGDKLEGTTQEVVSTINEAHADTVSGKSPDGNDSSSYGIHFESNYYVYFVGTLYNQASPGNKRTDLSGGVTFSQIRLPGNNIIFEQVTGEVLNFDANQNAIEIQDTNTGQTTTITISRYGGVRYE